MKNTLTDIAKILDSNLSEIGQLLADRDAALDPNPIYIQVLTAIGGWIAASFLLGAFGFLLATSLGYSLPDLIGVGAGLFVRRQTTTPFMRQMGAGLIVSGQMGFSLGMMEFFDNAGIGVFLIFAALVSGITIFIERRGLVGPTTFAVTLVGLAIFLLEDTGLGAYRNVVFPAICTVITLGVFIKPLQGIRIEYFALVSLVGLVIFAEVSSISRAITQVILEGQTNGPGFMELWGGNAVIWMAALALLYWACEILSTRIAIGTAILVTLFAATLSFTINAAALLLLAGVVIGWRLAALSGAAVLLWSLSRYYYDLSLTLLEKSILLMVVGVVLLVAAYLMQKIHPAGERL